MRRTCKILGADPTQNGQMASIFTVRRSYASAVLGVIILSICPSHACLWQKQTMHCGYFDTTQKGNHSSFQTPTVVGGNAPSIQNLHSKWTTPSKHASSHKITVLKHASHCLSAIAELLVHPCYNIMHTTYFIDTCQVTPPMLALVEAVTLLSLLNACSFLFAIIETVTY